MINKSENLNKAPGEEKVEEPEWDEGRTENEGERNEKEKIEGMEKVEEIKNKWVIK